MSEQTFEKGWVVQLKSGGPQMTVTHYGDDSLGEKQVWCQWFNNVKPPYKLESDMFDPAVLSVIRR